MCGTMCTRCTSFTSYTCTPLKFELFISSNVYTLYMCELYRPMSQHAYFTYTVAFSHVYTNFIWTLHICLRNRPIAPETGPIFFSSVVEHDRFLKQRIEATEILTFLFCLHRGRWSHLQQYKHFTICKYLIQVQNKSKNQKLTILLSKCLELKIQTVNYSFDFRLTKNWLFLACLSNHASVFLWS